MNQSSTHDTLLIEPLKTPTLIQQTLNTIKRKLAFPLQRLKNTYYCTHKTKVYPEIGRQLLQHHEKNGLYKPVHYMPTLKMDLYLVTEPKLMKALLKYPRLAEGDLLSEGRQLRVIADALGQFRLNQEKGDIKPKRSVMANLLMHPEQYFPSFFTITDALAQSWASHQHPFSITQSISEYTLRIFLQPILNYNGPVARFVTILEEQIDLLGQHFIFKKPPHFHSRFMELRNELVSILYPDRKPANHDDAYTKRLNDYIQNHHHDYEHDAFATGVNSGTLASYLAPNPAFIAAVYELGNHPEWQMKIRQEWRDAQANGQSREAYIESADTLLHAVIHEVLRLHPPQPFLFRHIERDFCLDGRYVFTKDSELVIDIYHSLRDVSRFGEDAARFNPERFIKNPSLYQGPFLVYSSGPNSCTGQMFSKLTMKVFLQTLCAHFQWKTLNQDVKHRFHFAMTFDQDIEIEWDITEPGEIEDRTCGVTS